jgi:nicotinamidase-related amidase
MEFKSGLRKPVHSGCMHLCIDMQNLFGPGSPWFIPWTEHVVPNIVQICHHFSYSTVFTRFMSPRSPEAEIGTWRTISVNGVN